MKFRALLTLFPALDRGLIGVRHKAPFIWTPQQYFDHKAYGAMLRGGTHRREHDGPRWFFVRREFSLSGPTDMAKLSITVDGYYKLSINGEFVATGPARSSPHLKRVDTHDIHLFLRPGRNVIGILVYVPGCDLAWYEAMRGGWQPVFGDGGLWVYFEARIANQTVTMTSDTAWKIERAICWRSDAPQEGWGQSHVEILDGAKYPIGWDEAGFDDTGWPNAVEMVSLGDEADQAIGRGRYVPFPALRDRGMPNLEYEIIEPEGLWWHGSVTSEPDVPLQRRPFEEVAGKGKATFRQLPEGYFFRSGEEHSAAAAVWSFSFHTGMPRLLIEAEGGEVIDIAVSERLPGEHENRSPGPLRTIGPHASANMMQYVARPGRQWIEKLEWAAIRGLQVTVRNAPAGIIVRNVSSRRASYPVKLEGLFECSSAELTRLWRMGAETARWCMHDAWQDCPGREKRQWIGDAALALPVALAAFGTAVLPLHRAFLEETAASQRRDGLLQMFAPGDHGQNGMVIPDFSLRFILTAREYLEASMDAATIEYVFPAIEKVLYWFAKHVGETSLLRELPEWHFLEWADIGRSGESCTINALYAAALKAASHMADIIERPRRARSWAEEAQRVIDALNRRHWDPRRKAYVDEVDPETGQLGRRVSQQGNALMVLFGFAPSERHADIISHITKPESVKVTSAPPIVFSDEPFDDTRHVVAAQPLFAGAVYEAMMRVGRSAEAIAALLSAYKPMIETSSPTLWESYSPNASLCHVFSAHPVFAVTSNIIRVTPLDADFSRVKLEIDASGLKWARAKVPTRAGTIEADWRINHDTIEIRSSAPVGTQVVLCVPDGFRPVEGPKDVSRFRLPLKASAS